MVVVQKRISGPLLDRIGIHLEVPRIPAVPAPAPPARSAATRSGSQLRTNRERSMADAAPTGAEHTDDVRGGAQKEGSSAMGR